MTRKGFIKVVKFYSTTANLLKLLHYVEEANVDVNLKTQVESFLRVMHFNIRETDFRSFRLPVFFRESQQ